MAFSAARFVNRLGSGAWDMVTGAGAAFLRLPTHLSIAFFALLLSLFLMVNAGAVFAPEVAERFQTAIIAYLMFQVTFAANFGVPNPFKDYSIGQFALVFAVAFVAGATAILSLAAAAGYTPQSVVAAEAGLALVVVTVFVIAYSEEIAFRWYIPAALTKPLKIKLAAQVFSAALFAGFHYAVYQGGIAPLAVAFVAGAFFGLVKETIGGPAGLTTAIALHSAYNAFALGLL